MDIEMESTPRSTTTAAAAAAKASDFHDHDHVSVNRGSKYHQERRPPKPKSTKLLNPLQKGIMMYLTTHHTSQPQIQSQPPTQPNPPASPPQVNPPTLLSPTDLPTRFTIYAPLLLFPVNALTTPPPWATLYASLTPTQRQTLFKCIIAAFARYSITHVAINAPITLTTTHGAENTMRSPVGLVPLFGDFGPVCGGGSGSGSSSSGSGNGNGNGQPSEQDLREAFWVSTVQNHGIRQVWAPLYTMFSRGNVTEKARILGLGGNGGMEGLEEDVGEMGVVDLYAGIGYFVFSYLKRGVKRGGEGGEDGGLEMEVRELVEGLREEDRVVVFHGDNRFAEGVLTEAKALMEAMGTWSPIRHVNLGLLPSSAPAWGSACALVTADMGRLRAEVLGVEEKGTGEEAEVKVAECRHVEQVKTYAPGVMHCVFDVRLAPRGEVSGV
ncbi:hypothetical protein BO70DRAFT_428496 [Aspergillus heteromorphus CBS 117.55]|uniref:tRNA wybutosine-synthesizing protein 2 n=1 Tax=Aspergillus heteromorphus CBS 117.55 TaxID=1448321 RepID=A0A317WF54_9EURO|nr:uncharacterized protein BO70DRAFT_428496 [Aspergillus heteromorphus CBS 117.55]PWY84909.1 hypothetical protein BO70DRAFT_428496 [Aspergillus heteromorphus CBS 117.55]